MESQRNAAPAHSLHFCHWGQSYRAAGQADHEPAAAGEGPIMGGHIYSTGNLDLAICRITGFSFLWTIPIFHQLPAKNGTKDEDHPVKAVRIRIWYLCAMNELSTIKKILLQLKPELIDRFHISSIGLFGSVVRDDFREDSDIDIIVDFRQPIGIEFIDLADYLENKINRQVDLVSRKAIKPKYLREIESEIIYV